MALRPRKARLLALLALCTSAALAHELWHWHQTRRYNVAVAENRFAQAAQYNGEHGIFAKAYAAQARGQYQEARILYSKLEHSDDKALRAAVLFNMGNTYLEQAALVDMKKDADLAYPLIELAKVSYRELLRLDPLHWDAKFNLERALRLLPDSKDKRIVEIEGRRGTVRTVISADVDENLP